MAKIVIVREKNGELSVVSDQPVEVLFIETDLRGVDVSLENTEEFTLLKGELAYRLDPVEVEVSPAEVASVLEPENLPLLNKLLDHIND